MGLPVERVSTAPSPNNKGGIDYYLHCVAFDYEASLEVRDHAARYLLTFWEREPDKYPFGDLEDLRAEWFRINLKMDGERRTGGSATASFIRRRVCWANPDCCKYLRGMLDRSCIGNLWLGCGQQVNRELLKQIPVKNRRDFVASWRKASEALKVLTDISGTEVETLASDIKSGWGPGEKSGLKTAVWD